MQKYKITSIINIADDPVSFLKFMDVDFESVLPAVPEDFELLRADAIKAANDFTENLDEWFENIRLQIHQPMVWRYLPNGALSELFNPFEKD